MKFLLIIKYKVWVSWKQTKEATVSFKKWMMKKQNLLFYWSKVEGNKDTNKYYTKTNL